MLPIKARVLTAALMTLCVAAAACGSARSTAGPMSAHGPPSSRPPITNIPRLPVTDADVHFMSGMIPHHAQAVRIARWAPTHGARNDVRILAERIVVAQRDEIAMMQTWLRDNGKPVPDSNATHMRMNMNGQMHDMLMPGMLTDRELAQLDSARGPAFDRLFLTFMIRHHEGALEMVDELLKAPGAAQDENVFRFASDVYADQTTEIDRMQKMLEGRSIPFSPRAP